MSEFFFLSILLPFSRSSVMSWSPRMALSQVTRALFSSTSSHSRRSAAVGTAAIRLPLAKDGCDTMKAR